MDIMEKYGQGDSVYVLFDYVPSKYIRYVPVIAALVLNEFVLERVSIRPISRWVRGTLLSQSFFSPSRKISPIVGCSVADLVNEFKTSTYLETGSPLKSGIPQSIASSFASRSNKIALIL